MLDIVERLLAGHRPNAVPVDGRAAASAVLVPLFTVGRELGILFIRRSDVRGSHRGQMGFPGGMAEPSDGADLMRTALRETQEELGILVNEVRVLGRLSDTMTVANPVMVTPFVGVIPHPYVFAPDPLEVKSVHSARLRDLSAAVMDGPNPFSLPPPVYLVDGQPVWGVSARILEELLGVLSPLFA